MFLSFNSSSEFLLISTFSYLSQIHNLLNITFSVTAELFNIFLIMLITFSIMLLLKICSSFIMSEVSENLNFS